VLIISNGALAQDCSSPDAVAFYGGCDILSKQKGGGCIIIGGKTSCFEDTPADIKAENDERARIAREKYEAEQDTIYRGKLDRPVAVVPGSVTLLRMETLSQLSTIFHMRVEGFPAVYFSVADVNDYQYRIARRSCADSDITYIFLHGGYHKYIMYGSDNKLITSFIIDLAYCKTHF
jgi:hypothetical protein